MFVDMTPIVSVPWCWSQGKMRTAMTCLCLDLTIASTSYSSFAKLSLLSFPKVCCLHSPEVCCLHSPSVYCLYSTLWYIVFIPKLYCLHSFIFQVCCLHSFIFQGVLSSFSQVTLSYSPRYTVLIPALYCLISSVVCCPPSPDIWCLHFLSNSGR